VLLRLGRLVEVQPALSVALYQPDRDLRLAARGLIGAARVRSGDETALAYLEAVHAEAQTAARDVRSEIALHVALAQFVRRDYVAAEAALDRISVDADIVYARALEYRGWIAMVRGDHERSTAAFIDALDHVDRSRRRDLYAEANCTQALAGLALERFDRPAWAIVARRRALIDWSADSLKEHRFFVAMRAAVFAYDVEGDPLQAAWEARCAEEWAPSDVFRVQALCCRAQIARKARESVSQRNHVEAAYRLFSRLTVPLGDGDAVMVPLVLAEELANAGRGGEARAMLVRFQGCRFSPTLSMSHDPRVVGFEKLVDAQVLEAEGRFDEAIGAFREAFDFFKRAGSLRRSLTAAVRLLRLSPDDEHVRRHVDAVAARTAKGSWIAALAEGLRRVHAAGDLSHVQRQYLGLLCDGKSNPEIARICKRSVHTVRNQVAALFETFGVQSRTELVALCARLGILDFRPD